LGWGGWWGWDPVENSSLIPWIVAVTLVHTMLVQKKTGKLARTNVVLAIAGFVLVIYSTFLTRSGILGSASVHSFADPGAVAYSVLVVWILSITGLGGFAVAKRWNAMKALAQPVGTVTRESLLAIGAALLSASALIILFGTSWPILGLSSVEPAFYDRMNLPIAVALGIAIGLSLLVQWNMESGVGLIRRSLRGMAIAAVLVAGLVIAGVRDPGMVVLAFSSFFAFVVSVEKIVSLRGENFRWIGGPLAHIGVAMLFLAIIGSGFYGEKQTLGLPLDEPKEVLGYTLTYQGASMLPDGKYAFHVQVEKDGKQFVLAPVMYQASYNNSLMRNPDYSSFLTRDVYIEPVSLEAGSGGHDHAHAVIDLKRGEPTQVGDMTLTFVQFDMGEHGTMGMTSGGGFQVGAAIEVQRGNTRERITPMTFYREGKQPEAREVHLSDGSVGFELLSMNIDPETKQSVIQIHLSGVGEAPEGPVKKELLVVEASVKPFMSFIWIAAVLVTLGAVLAIIQRKNEARPVLELQRRTNGRNTKTRPRAPHRQQQKFPERV
ncbi:MAG: cytochrome c-type biogenesis CcmF C-terminal domain-containing protein, partial [Bacteroidota bacterium]